ncbi:adenylate/guanylate cyclase domain-containing protein, partial [bacterium]|nr:adenylate/guanylate cyclase domain-containing protein [bacterium]
RIDKFTGKSSLSIFSGDSDPQDMVDLLRDLQKQLSQFNSTHGEQIEVKFGVGLAKGFVVLGHVGSKHRKDFTAIGSTVNKAARLEALASKTSHQTNIYFDQVCLDQFVELDLKYDKCQSVHLKGYKEEQSVYELL